MRAVLLLIFLCLSQVALGDSVGYGEIKDINAEGAQIVATHHHDWSGKTQAARWRMISTNQNPFTKENTYSYLRAKDKVSGKLLFQEPVPALTYLWVSPDSRFVVGVSNIQLLNPVQLVVFTRTGERIFAKQIQEKTWPGVSQSVTNWVHWYREPNPAINIEEKRGEIILSIEGNTGEPRVVRFTIPK